MTITTPATGRVSLFALMVSVTTALLAAEVAGSEEPETVSLEEITVTAQRRSESLQTVPIAITAVTAADIGKRRRA